MSKKKATKKQEKSRRGFYVFTTLAAALTMTGGLLVAISPQPLRPEGGVSLSATVEGEIDPLAGVSGTTLAGRWQYVYVHHSMSAYAPARGEGATDHFIVDANGRVEKTALWNLQRPASSPTGNGSIDPGCISICVVGDFDQAPPTAGQHHRVVQLIDSLQSQFHMSNHCVIMLDQPGSMGSIGKQFPKADFRSQLLQ
ncbi:MAG TPA: N-acetylmuramoyl-L-alanine amidase [Tepidisphaeraceae bacterium]|nr:N-acetylmuramoyl-L-alanine amidase [Tepidisphaeraceae bacterium]